MISGKSIGAISLALVAVLALGSRALAREVSNVNLSYGADAASEVGITWKSDGAATGSIVKYGLEEGGYDSEQEGAEVVVNGLDELGVLHEAYLSKLSPATTYYYVVGSEAGWSGEYSFKTGPVPHPTEGTASFVVWGDSRGDGYPVNTTLPDLLDYISDNYESDLQFFTGDAAYSGTAAELSEWLDEIEAINSLMPISAVAGNHEINMELYFAMFALPQGDPEGDLPEAFFSFDYGNIHFVMLNDNFLFIDQDKVTEFLERDLAGAQKLWKFVMHHRPLYSACNHGPAYDLQQAWEPIFAKYGVDVVFNGHDHNYERTHSLTYREGGASEVAANPWEGTTYVVTNGMGDNLYSSGNEYWTAHSESRTNFTAVYVENDKLELIAVDPLTQEIIDRLEYTKPIPAELQNIAPAADASADDDDDDGGGIFGCGHSPGGAGGAWQLLLLLAGTLFFSRRKRSVY